jgi:fructose-bisphosphate aldolase class I
MNASRLTNTVAALMADGKGLIAMDESLPTCHKRFAALGIPQTEPMRRAWRDLIVTTPGLGRSISGAILFEETIRQRTLAEVPFAQALEQAGIVPGIKVDAGARPLAGFAGEQVTEGLDGLRDRLAEYAAMGARFAKWRAVIRIDGDLPSRGCLAANAHALARYAALCQEAGVVPIVEPEVLMDGEHTLARCLSVTEATLNVVFDELRSQRVALEGLLLKPNMVVPGEGSADAGDSDAVADATIGCFLRSVPAAVGGIAFLSGGQAAALASARLNAMHVRFASRLPWPLTFSFSRAIQQPALDLWRGQAANVAAAQQALLHRAECNRAARLGCYDLTLDAPEVAAA